MTIRPYTHEECLEAARKDREEEAHQKDVIKAMTEVLSMTDEEMIQFMKSGRSFPLDPKF